VKKVQKIRIDESEEELLEGIGISSSYSDYRLAWTLNDFFHWRLEFHETPLEIPLKKTKDVVKYHYYHFWDELEKMQLILIKNRQGGKPLLEDYPQFDFVLFFKNNFSLDLNQMLDLLRGLECIFAAYRCNKDDFSIASLLNFEYSYE
jgi:hypothetical protein